MKATKGVVKVLTPRTKDGVIASHMAEVLKELGEDAAREGLASTPQRAEKALRFLTSGYETSVDDIINGAVFHEKCDEIILVKDIEFFSLCEHHLLPFYGKVHVAYLPKDKILGLSKIPRIVDMYARRLQVQERLTLQIAKTIEEVLEPQGVGVICEARHFCMMMRGVEKQHSGTVTSAMLGALRDRKDTRDEFLSLVRQNSLQF
jgi:GTP cyclohydrolase IA